MSAINLQLSPVNNILNQISLDNPADPGTTPPTPAFVATDSMVSFASPSALAQPDAQGNNSQVIMSAVPGQAEGGPWQFTYRRLLLNELIQGYTPTLVTYALTPAELDNTLDTILDLNATLRNVLAQLLNVSLPSAGGIALDFVWSSPQTIGEHPDTGYTTDTTIAVKSGALTLADTTLIPVSLVWPARPGELSLDTLAVTSLPGFQAG